MIRARGRYHNTKWGAVITLSKEMAEALLLKHKDRIMFTYDPEKQELTAKEL